MSLLFPFSSVLYCFFFSLLLFSLLRILQLFISESSWVTSFRVFLARETSQLDWFSPDEAIAKFRREEIWLPPPTYVTLSEVSGKAYTHRRSSRGKNWQRRKAERGRGEGEEFLTTLVTSWASSERWLSYVKRFRVPLATWGLLRDDSSCCNVLTLLPFSPLLPEWVNVCSPPLLFVLFCSSFLSLLSSLPLPLSLLPFSSFLSHEEFLLLVERRWSCHCFPRRLVAFQLEEQRSPKQTHDARQT